MEKVSRAIFVSAALVLSLVGCQKTEQPAVVATERQVVVDATPIQQTPTRDPSLPDAATALAQQEAAEKAKAESTPSVPPAAAPQEPMTKPADETTAAQQKASPQEPMTKEEEAKAMPLPSQPNDHSTTALDKNTQK
jgi:uncharacterized lipoprotein NlpE involved in copper resistance